MKQYKMLKTIQPYYVFKTEKFYQAVYAKDGISHFYSFEFADDILIVPNACIDVLFEYSMKELNIYVIGNMTKCNSISIKKECRYFGVRFKPLYVPFFLEGADIVDNLVKIEDVIKVNIFKELEEKKEFSEQISAFLQIYLWNYENKSKMIHSYSLLKECKNIICENKGDIRISELEECMGYSSRYINKIFLNQVGYSAKSFCKIVRFQNILEYINSNEEIKLIDIAQKFGYYDQSQMIKEFRCFSGVNPKEYLKLKENYNEKIIEVPIFTI